MGKKSKQLLTPLELKVMNLLWKRKKAFVKELLKDWPEQPPPNYNTISTIVRILQENGFVNHQAFGRTHQYYPAISKLVYQKRLLGNIVDQAFSGSAISLVAALVQNKGISEQELDEIQALIDDSKE